LGVFTTKQYQLGYKVFGRNERSIEMPLFGPPNVEGLKAKGDVKGLIKALSYRKDSGTVRKAAAEALVKIGIPAIEQLITALDDTDVFYVRSTAAKILDQMLWQPNDMYDFVPVPGLDVLFAKYPVTNAQYARFLDSPDSAESDFWADQIPQFDEDSQPMKAPKGKVESVRSPRTSFWEKDMYGKARPSAPVVGVTWYQANAYCRWLLKHWEELPESKGLASPKLVRLPTSVEWTQAAGGEGPPERFPWDLQGKVTPDEQVKQFANTWDSAIHCTTPVWMYPGGASPYGVIDLSGNVWEWQANYGGAWRRNLALGTGWVHKRGGSWKFKIKYARVAEARINHYPNLGDETTGFRVVCLSN